MPLMRADSEDTLCGMSVPAEAKSKRILIISSSVGSGHNAVARAICDGLAAVAPEIKVDIIDALDFAARGFASLYAGTFALGMSRFPSLYGLGFRATNRPHRQGRGACELARLRLERAALRRFEDYLLDARPELVVNTHFLASPLLGRLIARGRLNAKQLVVVTDIEAHRFWYSQNVDRWCVPAEHTAAQLSRWGIPADRVVVSGIPVHHKWSMPLKRADVLRDWRLPADRNIVLVSGGTDFTCGPIVKIARRIVAACRGAYVVVLAGRNKKLLAGLAGLPETPKDILPVGFTDRVHELTEVSSLVVTKPGGVFTAECLAKAKPMIFIKPVPGHEGGNARYLASQGAGVIARSASEIAETAAGLLADKQSLEGMAAAAGRLHKPGTEIVVDVICAAQAGN